MIATILQSDKERMESNNGNLITEQPDCNPVKQQRQYERLEKIEKGGGLLCPGRVS